MAIAVASKSAMVSANYPSGSSITLTAPTGITAGDLLVIVGGGYANGTPTGGVLENYSANSGVISCTGFTEAYFHSYDSNANSGVGGVARVNVLYKIAEVADQSAANYTVNQAFSLGWAAIMFRITGWSTGNPFAHGNLGYTAYSQDGSQTLTWSGSVTRPSQHVMLMYACTGGDSDFSFYYANYASTPSETWTEAGDTFFNQTNNDGGALAVAYATSSSTSNLTAFQFDKYLDSSDGPETTIAGVLLIFTPVNVSGTNGLHSVSPTFFSNQGVNDGLGNAALKTISPTVNDASGSGSTKVWTERSKNTTTWTPR